MKNNRDSIQYDIKFHSKNQASSIGIISGADSPKNEKKMKELENFYEYASHIIKPFHRTFEDVGEMLINKYHATLHTPNEKELTVLKSNVILNKYIHILDEEQIIESNSLKINQNGFLKMNSLINKAREYDADKIGLSFIFYHIEKLNDKECDEFILIGMEKQSEYIEILHDTDGMLSTEILLFNVITEDDIALKSVRFKAYACMLRSNNVLDYQYDR